ncbi:MAG TPA: hypothetical protein VMY88_08080 [Acidimicrobiales bacterium]|nr:hypothetical protein [Acidimicrobiales bacterium]
MERSRLGSLAGNALVGSLGAALLLGAAAMAASIVRRSEVPVEAISRTTVAVSIGAAVVVAAGVLLLALIPHRDLVVLSMIASILILVSVVGLFSIGILVLPFAGGAVYLAARRGAGRSRVAPAVIAGPATGIALAVLFVVWVQPPLVECTEAGASTTSRPWWSTGTSCGEGSSTVSDGADVSSGSVETPSGNFTFRCRDGELTQFRPSGGR